MRRAAAAIIRNCHASAAVEFALLAPVILTVLIGTIEAGRAVWVRNTLQFAAEETARFSMLNRAASNGEISSHALSRLAGLDAAAVQVNVAREYASGTEFVEIELAMEFAWVVSLINGEPMRLAGSSRVPLID